MSSLTLNGDTSGSILIQAPAVAGSGTLTLPVGTGTIAAQGVSSNIVSGTVVTASGTTIDFTSIPSWVKRITVMFAGVSTNGTADVMIRFGTSSGIVSSGYLGVCTNNTTVSNLSTGFRDGQQADSVVRHGSYIFSYLGNNIWTCSAVLGRSDAATLNNVAGSVSLGATLTTVRVTTTNGTDTFDAGSINILYE